MAVKIRLKRHGKIRAPHYRIVVADSRTHRDGRVIEEIGRYIPTENPSFIEVNSERAQYWLGVGAQPTEQVAVLLKLTGDFQASKGDKNAKNTVQVKAAKPEFVIDSKKKTVLIPKDELAAKKAAPVAEEAAAVEEVAAEATEAAVETPAVEEVAAEAPAAEAEVVAEAPAEEVAVEAAPAAEAAESTEA
ncbi:30S ribosomal protein S16 [Rhodoluna sp.]|uniref:30S ribosomal protein S16 n=1 Tax=Rhodoluna sp. TaxID=1969481 RepID=UPI0025FA8F1F|nr:30S ribosomal protein S16 [Rhodoluna sp.]